MNLFQQLWQNWLKFDYGKPSAEEQVWINELNQAVYAQLEKRLPSHIQLRVVTTPAFVYYTENEDECDGVPVGGFDSHAATVATMRLRLPIPEGPFEKRVELVTELLLELIDDKPETRTAFLYWPVYPLGNELVGGEPNRRFLVTRLRTTPHVAVDAGGTPGEGNT